MEIKRAQAPEQTTGFKIHRLRSENTVKTLFTRFRRAGKTGTLETCRASGADTTLVH
jgi:hypothetical protein